MFLTNFVSNYMRCPKYEHTGYKKQETAMKYLTRMVKNRKKYSTDSLGSI